MKQPWAKLLAVIALTALQSPPAMALTLRPCPEAPGHFGHHIFATAAFLIPVANQRAFQSQLGIWAQRSGYTASGGRRWAPHDPDGWVIDLSANADDDWVEVTYRFAANSPGVVVTVSKWCVSDQGDWRRHWRQIRSQMLLWGYRPVSVTLRGAARPRRRLTPPGSASPPRAR